MKGVNLPLNSPHDMYYSQVESIDTILQRNIIVPSYAIVILINLEYSGLMTILV